jgi:hypothetical protein
LLNKQVPLVLDLDGTLIRTDTFHEMMVQLLIKKPWKLFFLPFWFLQGRAYTKAKLVEATSLSPHELPYNPHILKFAHIEAKKGRPLFLATGSDQRIAQKIADHVGLFQDVMGSNGKINLTGANKEKALTQRFGHEGFDYVGDSMIDLHVWKSSSKAIVAHPKRGVLSHAITLKGKENTQLIPREIPRLTALILSLRPLFWTLNLFLVSWWTVLGLCILSSGLLIGGDLLSLYEERAGSFKKSVFAEGHLHLHTAFMLSPLLILIACTLLPLTYLLIYIPLFGVIDHYTRPISQTWRWLCLSAYQTLFIVFLIKQGF